MKQARIMVFGLVIGLVLSAPGLTALQQAKTPPQAKAEAILGDWNLQIDAGGEYYYLSMTLLLQEKKLAGKVSESNGWFTDVPMTDISWDGTILKFKLMAPTPPDGAERSLETELKLAEGKWAGMMNIPDLGMTAAITGAKK
ncbi:MAG: hypothetical protein JW843_01215 [Candidatus Aminicenantes bacterium]|nr:hypothetical protein [Candidatus Aminicenantes bacterium]